MNKFMVDKENSNLTPQDFIKNLPFAEEAFDVTFFDNENQADTFDEYSEQVF